MFYDYVLPRKLAKNTIKAYEDDFNAINNHSSLDFDEAPVTALTSQELRAAFASYAIDHKAASIRRVHSTWKAFFKFLVVDGHVDGSPMDAVPSPKPPKREPLAFEGWEDDFVPKLIDGVMNAPRPTRYPIYVWRERDLAVVSMLLATGARASELCGMNLNS